MSHSNCFPRATGWWRSWTQIGQIWRMIWPARKISCPKMWWELKLVGPAQIQSVKILTLRLVFGSRLWKKHLGIWGFSSQRLWLRRQALSHYMSRLYLAAQGWGQKVLSSRLGCAGFWGETSFGLYSIHAGSITSSIIHAVGFSSHNQQEIQVADLIN